MADFPIVPTDTDLERFEKFLDVQKQLSDNYLRYSKLYQEGLKVGLSVESRIIERRQQEAKALDIIRNKVVELAKLREDLGRVTSDTERDAAKGAIESAESQIAYQQKLVNMIRMAGDVELEMTKKQFEHDRRWFKFTESHLEKIFGLRIKELGETEAIGNTLMDMGVKSSKLAFTYGAILTVLKSTFDLFKSLDKSAWEFRKATGMTREGMAGIRTAVDKTAISMMHIGVTADSLYKSISELGKSMGGIHNVSIDLAKNISVMSAQLGISEELSARFLRNMGAMTKSTMQSQSDTMYMAQYMSEAAGVNLGQVMGDVASRLSTTLMMMSRLPNAALKTAIELRRMGSSMDSAARGSAHILDFTQNIQEEMEASVLLGRSINLQRARELAYAGKLEESTQEILKITKQNHFEKMDYFQKKAFAAATGRSVDELMNMLQVDREISNVRDKGTDAQKAQLKLYEKMKNENAAAAKARAKDVGYQLTQKSNQERITAITAKWNQILAQAGEWLLPVIDNLLSAIIPAMDLGKAFFAWTGAFKLVTAGISRIYTSLRTLVALPARIATGFMSVARAILYLPFTIANIATRLSRFPMISNMIMGVATRLLPIWLKIEETVRRIGQWFIPLINGVRRLGQFLAPVGRIFTSIFGAIGRFGAGVGRVFAAIGRFIAPVVRFFGELWQLAGRILAPIGKFFGFLGKVGGVVGRFAGFIGFFAKWIPILGWVITAFQFIGNLFKRLHGIGEAFKGGILNGIWFGIKAIGGAIYDTLIQPFVDVWNWVKSIFVGKSPSKLALGILNGIASIGAKMFSVLIWPYKMAFKFIANAAMMLGKLIWKGITAYFNMWKSIGTLVWNGVKSLGTIAIKALKGVLGGVWNFITSPFKAVANFFKKPVESRAQAAYVPAVTVSPSGTKIETGKKGAAGDKKEEKEAAKPMSEETGKQIVALLEKILAKDTNVKMDGQLLGTSLARQTEFRGGYGVNKVS